MQQFGFLILALGTLLGVFLGYRSTLHDKPLTPDDRQQLLEDYRKRNNLK